jgi:hypothetical protein
MYLYIYVSMYLCLSKHPIVYIADFKLLGANQLNAPTHHLTTTIKLHPYIYTYPNVEQSHRVRHGPRFYSEGAKDNVPRLLKEQKDKSTVVSWTQIPTTAEEFEPRMYHTAVLHPDPEMNCLVIYGGEAEGKQCVYVCFYVYIFLCIYVYRCIYMYLYIDVSMYRCIFMSMYLCTQGLRIERNTT